MIHFCEITINENHIRLVTKDIENSYYNEPIEFEINGNVNTIEEIITEIKNYLDNANLERNNE